MIGVTLLLRPENNVHPVYVDQIQSEIFFTPANDEFTNAFSVVNVRLEVRCEDCFDDLVAPRSAHSSTKSSSPSTSSPATATPNFSRAIIETL
jgi:hypothetical protein